MASFLLVIFIIATAFNANFKKASMADSNKDSVEKSSYQL